MKAESLPLHLGMPTLIESPTLAESLALCAELGLDFVELNMNLPAYQEDAIDIPAAKQLLSATGKYLTLHLDENLNVCDFNAAVAEAYLDTVMRTIRLAKELGAPALNMHLSDGVYFTLPDRKVYLFEQYRKQYLDRLRRFRDLCEREIGGAAILICIENCGPFHDFQQAGIDLLLEAPCFALTYDVGHDFCIGSANEAFLLARADRLRHMHLHDASGDRNHLPLGDGEVDITQNLVLAEAHGCRCVLEVKTVAGLRKSTAAIRA